MPNGDAPQVEEGQVTPQREAMPGEGQMPNAAGGWVYQLGPWDQLMRFLVLGSEGGTYYTDERTLTRDNALNVVACLSQDWRRAVDLIADVSHRGRASKNDPAIFALALAASDGSPQRRAYALRALPRVCRIPTHLFHFAEYCKGLRGWGKGLRKAVGRWYNSQSAERLAHTVAKYQQRDGWSNADLLRKAHPKAATMAHDFVYRWCVDGMEAVDAKFATAAETHRAVDFPRWAVVPQILDAFERAKAETTPAGWAKLVRDHGLTREMLPTQALTHREVWEALLDKMPMTAMVRNLGTMSKVGLLAPMSQAAATVVQRLTDAERLRKARVHPLGLLMAMKVYQSGAGLRGSGIWQPVSQVVDALDAGFYLSFAQVEPTGKRLLIGIDGSGSMGSGVIAGTMLTPREAAAAMALVAARTERQVEIIAYTTRIIPVELSPRERLDAVMRKIFIAPEGTDCAMPMEHAMQQKREVDAILTYTDNETWAGRRHPVAALREYRQRHVAGAKLVVVGMTATGHTIAPADDGGCLNVVGFDAAAPVVIADFVRGSLGRGVTVGDGDAS